MQAAGVERRRGNLAGARQVFERCLAILLEEPDKNIHSHVSIKFSRFLTMVCNVWRGLTHLLNLCVA